MTEMLFELADVPPAPIVSPAERELTEQGWEITTLVYEVPIDDWYDHSYEACHTKIFMIFALKHTRYFVEAQVYSDWDDEGEFSEYYGYVSSLSKNGVGNGLQHQTAEVRCQKEAFSLAQALAAGLVLSYEIRKQSEAA